MKVLVLGGGGREHAFAWKLSQSKRVAQVFVAPGNAGTALEPKTRNVPLDILDFDAVIAFVRREGIALTLVGPEAPLVAGIVDRFTEAGLAIIGPNRAGARLEGSKAFAKEFLSRHHIPTAAYRSFDAFDSAMNYAKQRALPIVIKADGLAAGKGVIIAATLEEAEKALRALLIDQALGGAGRRVVIEEFLQGEEASYMVLCDGKSIVPLATSQDHKRRDNGDLGPNTGGMGAYSPAPIVSADMEQRILQHIIHPVLDGLTAEGMEFKGFLYAGLMIDRSGGINVLEFNVRMGDPETQPILMRLQSDLFDLLEAAAQGKLAGRSIAWDPRPALATVLAAPGYPEKPRLGGAIDGLDQAQDECAKIFHAGTKSQDGRVVASGGRVLAVAALGEDLEKAQADVYRALARINCDDAFYRSDIGYRAIDRR